MIVCVGVYGVWRPQGRSKPTQFTQLPFVRVVRIRQFAYILTKVFAHYENISTTVYNHTTNEIFVKDNWFYRFSS